MTLLQWRPEFSVCDPAVDHEHKELIDLVNDAASALLKDQPEAEIDRAFGDLLQAISSHFAHEERRAGLLARHQALRARRTVHPPVPLARRADRRRRGGGAGVAQAATSALASST